MKNLIILSCLLLAASCTPAYAINYLQTPAPRQHVANAPIAGTASTTSAQLVAANLLRTGQLMLGLWRILKPWLTVVFISKTSIVR